jgi:hypothetical protein
VRADQDPIRLGGGTRSHGRRTRDGFVKMGGSLLLVSAAIADLVNGMLVVHQFGQDSMFRYAV